MSAQARFAGFQYIASLAFECICSCCMLCPGGGGTSVRSCRVGLNVFMVRKGGATAWWEQGKWFFFGGVRGSCHLSTVPFALLILASTLV